MQNTNYVAQERDHSSFNQDGDGGNIEKWMKPRVLQEAEQHSVMEGVCALSRVSTKPTKFLDCITQSHEKKG